MAAAAGRTLASVAAGAAGCVFSIPVQLVAHASELAPFVAVWFAVHAVVQYGVPLLFPAAYDGLRGPKGGKGNAETTRRAAGREARTMIVASLHAAYVAVLAAYGLWLAALESPGGAATATSLGSWLKADLYAESRLSTHIVRVATSYFIWDVIVCITDGYSLAFHAHAWACLFVFSNALVRSGAARACFCS